MADEEKRANKELQQRAELFSDVLDTAKGAEFMKELRNLAGMDRPSAVLHPTKGLDTSEMLLKDGMKTLYCKIETLRELGNKQ